MSDTSKIIIGGIVILITSLGFMEYRTGLKEIPRYTTTEIGTRYTKDCSTSTTTGSIEITYEQFISSINNGTTYDCPNGSSFDGVSSHGVYESVENLLQDGLFFRITASSSDIIVNDGGVYKQSTIQ